MRYLILPLILLLGSAWGYKFFDHRLLEKDSPDHYYFEFTSQEQNLKMSYLYKRPVVYNGKTILLLHGKNFSSAYWEETMAFLNKQGYCVVAPDQLGFGNSSQPLSYQFTFQQLAYNTKLLLDSLRVTSVIVLGHSMGGMLATRFALMYPARCSKLILEDPIGLEDWKLSVPYSPIDQENQAELAKTRDDLRDYMTKNYFHNSWQPAYEALLDENEKHLESKNFHAYAKNMALTSDMIYVQPVCYEFKNLQVPTALIIGLLDRAAIGRERTAPETGNLLGNYPVLGKKTAGQIKNCQLFELPGIGHVPHIENFNQFSCNLLLALKSPGPS